MKDKIVSGYGMSYKRLTKTSARKAFDNGMDVYVMSADRNPVNSMTSPHIYSKGCKALCYWVKPEIDTFDDLLQDFSEWLFVDGYGHMPQRYYVRNYRFSYWIREEQL